MLVYIRLIPRVSPGNPDTHNHNTIDNRDG
jgi:hypothetical protein